MSDSFAKAVLVPAAPYTLPNPPKLKTVGAEIAVYLPGQSRRIGMVQFRATDKRFKPRLFVSKGTETAVVSLPSCGTQAGAVKALIAAYDSFKTKEP